MGVSLPCSCPLPFLAITSRLGSSRAPNTMQVLLCSHRCVRLHTFEPEDRAYTSTPTKIGGHCLDHIRNGLTSTFIQSSSSRAPKDGRDHDGFTQVKPPTLSPTFDPKGRFGGLCDVVLRLSPSPPTPPPPPPPLPATVVSFSSVRLQQAQEVQLSSSMLSQQWGVVCSPLCSQPRELPLDTDAWEQGEIVEHGPNWPCSSSMNPGDERGPSLVGPFLDRAHGQQHNNNGGGVVNAAAGRHTGALMAVLLAKLVNGGGRSLSAEGSVADAAEVARVDDETTRSITPASLEARSELRKCVVAQVDAASFVASHDVAATSDRNNIVQANRVKGGLPENACMVAWQARLDQTPSYSKLRRYSFVRELGRGAHGTVVLVRKKSADKNNRPGRLRVLKESHFLTEAVNEARLLLLADGRGARAEMGEEDGPLGGDELVGAANGWNATVSKRRLVETVGASWGAGDSRPQNETTVATRDRGYRTGGVVQLHDFFVETLGHRSLAFLELEYCDGGDLHGLMLGEAEDVNGWRQRGAEGAVESVGAVWSVRGAIGLPVAQIGRLALGVCEGVQQLHEQGVIHRDLKPANVLLTKVGEVRIADLGVSTHLQPSRPLTESGAGTIPFMAPEVRKFLLGSKVAYSGKADAWAIGGLLYAMAIGNPAPGELVTATRAELVSVVGHRTGSERLALVAHKALDPDPASRSSVQQLVSLLRDCCRREGWLSQVAGIDRDFSSSVRRFPTAGLARL